MLFQLHSILVGMRMPSRTKGQSSIWYALDISGNVFAGRVVSFAAFYPQELTPWSSEMSEQIHSSKAEKSENQTPVPGSEMLVRTVSQKFSHLQ